MGQPGVRDPVLGVRVLVEERTVRLGDGPLDAHLDGDAVARPGRRGAGPGREHGRAGGQAEQWDAHRGPPGWTAPGARRRQRTRRGRSWILTDRRRIRLPPSVWSASAATARPPLRHLAGGIERLVFDPEWIESTVGLPDDVIALIRSDERGRPRQTWQTIVEYNPYMQMCMYSLEVDRHACRKTFTEKALLRSWGTSPKGQGRQTDAS